jgi:predicted GNAT family acetyltransferase
MIEDLFTLAPHRRRGMASAVIAAFVADLRRGGCDTAFLGARTAEPANRRYRRIGFEPVTLARARAKDKRRGGLAAP